jgi:colanic acid/amylovoran biosynthesis glycosyltransferase
VNCAPRILHYVPSWLPLSQQFVHGQIASSAFESLVVTRGEITNCEVFPHPRILSLDRDGSLSFSLLPWRVARVSRLLRLQRQWDARAFHLHFGYSVPDVDLFLRVSRLPFIVSLHGHDVTAFLNERPQHYRSFLRRAAFVVVPSQFLADRAIAAGAPSKNIRRVAAGVDTRMFIPSPLPEKQVVLFVGRLVEKKGIDTLMSAWDSLVTRVPHAELVVLGDGPLQLLVRGRNVAHVTPDATRPRAQVAELMRNANVVVTPSRTGSDGDSESCLLVNLEAMASARPVVSTYHGGIPEFVRDGETGLLVPENDPAALTRAVVAILEDGSLGGRLGRAGAAHVKQYDVRAAASTIDGLYETLLSNAVTQAPRTVAGAIGR